jgi:outer membrane receptor protein involved in Fe transport
MSQQKKTQEFPFFLTPIAAAISTALAPATAALAQDQGEAAREGAGELEEVIVTATKVEANVQDIPSSVQAMPEAMLQQMGALNTEDFVRFMPNVNWISFGAGNDNQVIFRGVHTSTGAYTMTRSASVYLDEIPLTSTAGDSPDIRMLDINRTEALSGPQGTLFGAAAQAGTLRFISNRPDPSKFEASAEAVFKGGDDSEMSHSVTAVLNLPLVEDKFAIRLAAQVAEDGGYIDNVYGHHPDMWFGETAAESAASAPPAWQSGQPYIWRCEQGQGDCVWGTNRLTWGRMDNADVAEGDWNSAEHTLYRVSARWDINDDWSVTAAYHYGETDGRGNHSYNPFVGDLQTINFVKPTSYSEWDMTALTIEADLGFAQFVSATSFYDNQRDYLIDNTLYYKYYTTNYCGDQGAADTTWYTWYYWQNPVTGRAIYLPSYCVTPVTGAPGDVTQIPDMAGYGAGPEWQERFSQEFRMSHQGEKFDWLAGLYYEDSKDAWDSVWMADINTPYSESMSYAFLEACAQGTVANYLCYGSYSANGYDQIPAQERLAALATATHYWHSSDRTDWEQKAVFGEFTWHVNDKTNVTFGGRWSETDNVKRYNKYVAGHTGPDGRQVPGFQIPNWIGNEGPQYESQDEFVPKLAVDYNIDDDKMLYGLYTEGFRVGGINRANRRAIWHRTLWGQTWEPDKLKNYEVGLKSRWADNSMQLNLAAFYMDWQDLQHEVVDPSVGSCVYPEEEPTCRPPQGTQRPPETDPRILSWHPTASMTLPWLSIVGNVGDAHASGITADFDWAVSDRLQVGGNLIWLEKEIDSTTADPASGVVPGLKLPNTPETQGSAWATYTWPVDFLGGGEMFFRAQASYTGSTHTELVPDLNVNGRSPSFDNDSYTIADLRLGLVSGDGDWQVDLFVSNVTDERAQVDQGCYGWAWGRTGEYDRVHCTYTVRPREFGIRLYTRWGGE